MSCPICHKDIEPSIKSSPMLTNGRIFDYAVCKDCGVAYHEPSISAKGYEAYNNWGWEHPGKVPYATKPKCEDRAREQWSTLQGVLKKGDRVFDIGCGAGSLVKMLKDAGYYADGLETSNGALAAAKQFYGLELWDIFPDDMYDVVCLHSVLEHVPDGERLISQALDILSGSGRLLIKMPAFDFQKTDWWAYSAEHPCLYTKRAICKLMADFDFELIESWIQGKRATYTFYDRGAK